MTADRGRRQVHACCVFSQGKGVSASKYWLPLQVLEIQARLSQRFAESFREENLKGKPIITTLHLSSTPQTLLPATLGTIVSCLLAYNSNDLQQSFIYVKNTVMRATL